MLPPSGRKLFPVMPVETACHSRVVVATSNVNSSPKLRVTVLLKKITIIRQRMKKMIQKTVNVNQDLYMAEGIGTYYKVLQWTIILNGPNSHWLGNP
jgi:hypothetical protein